MIMKRVLFISAFIAFSTFSIAQVGIGTTVPDASTILEISASDKGILIPKISLGNVTDTMLDGVNTAATGLLIYNTNPATTGGSGTGYYYFNSSIWERLDSSAGSSFWTLNGNVGTTSGTNFIGTTDSQDLSIRTNNTEKIRITTDGQIEVYNTGNSIFIGENAGNSDDLSTNNNVFIGKDAGMNNSSENNIALGTRALRDASAGANYNIGIGEETLFGNLSGTYNIALGYQSSAAITGGDYNVAMGYQALWQTASGQRNVGIGYQAGWNITGTDNIAIGDQAIRNATSNNDIGIGAGTGFFNQTGGNNTFVGHQAGYGTAAHNKSGSVFLGYQAGYNEQNSNRLYIDNSNTTSPLIYGEFDTNFARINGTFEVTGYSSFSASIDASGTAGSGVIEVDGNLRLDGNEVITNTGNTLYLQHDNTGDLRVDNTTFMVDASANRVGIGDLTPEYELDVAGAIMLEDMTAPASTAGHSGIYSNAGELNALDASGNSTVISPHHFSLVKPSEDMAWSFYSKNENIGKQVNVDMMKALRLIEKVTGEKLVYQADLKGNPINAKENLVSLVSELKTLSEENKGLKAQLEKQQREIEIIKEILKKN